MRWWLGRELLNLFLAAAAFVYFGGFMFMQGIKSLHGWIDAVPLISYSDAVSILAVIFVLTMLAVMVCALLFPKR
jgi:hypothetical protein